MAAVERPEPDPALVAAASPMAATVLGTDTAPATPGLAPATVIPALPASPPVPPTSRYASAGVAVWVDADGLERPFFRRRLVPQPEDLATAGWDTVQTGDRADLIAVPVLGDPKAFWQLCDANLAFDPVKIEAPGRLLRVALPEGFPPLSGGGSG